MKTSESIKALAPALLAAQSEMGAVIKGGQNEHDNYSYATLNDYVAATKKILEKHDFSLVTSVNGVVPVDGRVTSNGKPQYAMIVELSMRLIHKSGEWIEIESRGEGQDRADKSTYKAITGARKYAYAALFGLATADDPEGSDENGSTKGNGGTGAPKNRPVDDLL